MKLARFCLMVVKTSGEIIRPYWDDLELYAKVPALIDEIDLLFNQMGRRAFSRSELRKMQLEWLHFGGTAAAASVFYPETNSRYSKRHTLLLLSGQDRVLEAAALESCRKVVERDHPQVEFEAVVKRIQASPRPLLTSIGNDGNGRLDFTFIPTEGVLAAVYFYRAQTGASGQ